MIRVVLSCCSENNLYKRLRVARRPGGLAHDTISGLLHDRQGRLWISTSQGLERLSGGHGKQPQFEHVSARFGQADKALGVAIINPARFAPRDAIAPLVVTELKISGETIAPGTLAQNGAVKGIAYNADQLEFLRVLARLVQSGIHEFAGECLPGD